MFEILKKCNWYFAITPKRDIRKTQTAWIDGLSSITDKEGLPMKKANVSVRPENVNKPATSKQLWALYLASRKAGCTHDYRNDNLTMQQASDLLNKFNSEKQNIDCKHAIVSSNIIDKLKSYLLVAKQGIVDTMRKDFGIK
jgi:hypothetical protein